MLFLLVSVGSQMLNTSVLTWDGENPDKAPGTMVCTDRLWSVPDLRGWAWSCTNIKVISTGRGAKTNKKKIKNKNINPCIIRGSPLEREKWLTFNTWKSGTIECQTQPLHTHFMWDNDWNLMAAQGTECLTREKHQQLSWRRIFSHRHHLQPQTYSLSQHCAMRN